MSELAGSCRVFERPSLKSAFAILREAIPKHSCVMLVAHCKVEYQGRARSTLGSGDRIVLVKEDGALLVHRPTGYEPVNWQSSGSYLRTNLVGGALVLKAVRRGPSETLKVSFDQIHAVVVAKIIDNGRFDLHVSEEEMKKAIVAEPQILEEGFRPIAYEKRVEPGFIDIYGLDRSNRFVIVEIKRLKAGKNAVLQLARYVDEIRKMGNTDVRGVLAAPKISKDVQRLLATLNLEFKKIDLKRCGQVVKKTDERKIKDFM